MVKVSGSQPSSTGAGAAVLVTTRSGAQATGLGTSTRKPLSNGTPLEPGCTVCRPPAVTGNGRLLVL